MVRSVLPPETALNGQDEDAGLVVDAELVSADAPGPAGAEVQSVRADVRELVRSNPGVAVATAAAVAGTGFVAGAIATAVVGQKVSAGRRRREGRRLPHVKGSRSFLVDVHLLGDR